MLSDEIDVIASDTLHHLMGGNAYSKEEVYNAEKLLSGKIARLISLRECEARIDENRQILRGLLPSVSGGLMKVIEDRIEELNKQRGNRDE